MGYTISKRTKNAHGAMDEVIKYGRVVLGALKKRDWYGENCTKLEANLTLLEAYKNSIWNELVTLAREYDASITYGKCQKELLSHEKEKNKRLRAQKEALMNKIEQPIVRHKKDELFDHKESLQSLIDMQLYEMRIEAMQDEVVANEELRLAVIKILGTLTPREERIVSLYYGIGHHESLTLEEVAEQEDVSKERIRQILAKAERKLRHPSCSKKVKAFIDMSDTRKHKRRKSK